MRRQGVLRAAVLALVVALVVGTPRPGGSAPVPAAAPRWVRPVAGPVVVAFRPPADPYGPGHRGVTLAAAPGTQVVAAGAGTVVFVGTIAGVTWISIDHPGGLRTTYGYLGATAVTPGATVGAGTVIAVVGPAGRLHFGLRRGNAYLDPMQLFRHRIRLVPAR